MPEQLDWIAIAQEYFPTDGKDFAGYVLWNHTGYPDFYCGDEEQWFRQQLGEAANQFALATEAKIVAREKGIKVSVAIDCVSNLFEVRIDNKMVADNLDRDGLIQWANAA